REGLDVGELLQLDRARRDEVGAADIEVIAAATREVLELPAGIVLAIVEFESDALESLEQGSVELLRLLGDHLMAAPRQFERHRGRDQVVILERALVVG